MEASALRAAVASPRSAEQLFDDVGRASAIVLEHNTVLIVGHVTVMTQECWLRSTTACATTRKSSTRSWRGHQDDKLDLEQPSRRSWRSYGPQQQRRRSARAQQHKEKVHMAHKIDAAVQVEAAEQVSVGVQTEEHDDEEDAGDADGGAAAREVAAAAAASGEGAAAAELQREGQQQQQQQQARADDAAAVLEAAAPAALEAEAVPERRGAAAEAGKRQAVPAPAPAGDVAPDMAVIMAGAAAGAATGDGDTEDDDCGGGDADAEMEQSRAIIAAAPVRPPARRVDMPVGYVAKPARRQRAAAAQAGGFSRTIANAFKGGGFVDCAHCGEPAYEGQFCGRLGRFCVNFD